MGSLGFSYECLDFVSKNLNIENKIYIKALVMYYFIMNKTLSYEQVANLLEIDKLKLLDIYDELKVSTSEITIPDIENLLTKNNIITEESINEFNKKEGLLIC